MGVSVQATTLAGELVRRPVFFVVRFGLVGPRVQRDLDVVAAFMLGHRDVGVVAVTREASRC